MFFYAAMFLCLIIALPFVFSKYKFTGCAVAVYIAMTLFFFPVLYAEYEMGAIFATPVFSAQIFILGIPYDNILKLAAKLPDAGLMVFMSSVFYVLAPFCTLRFVILFLIRKFNLIWVRLLFGKNVYVFSKLTEKALILAKSIKAHDSKSKIIFSLGNEENSLLKDGAEEEGFLILKVAASHIFSRINSTNKVHIFFIGETSEDMEGFLAFVTLYSEKEANIYLFSHTPEAELIADSCKRNNIKLDIQLINEPQQISYSILEEYPLYKSINEESQVLNVTVLGAGHTGKVIAKDIVWCGQLGGYSLKLNIADKRETEKEFYHSYPELSCSDYDISFFTADVNDISLDKLLTETRVKDSNYIVVDLGNDTLNINTAKEVRTVLLRQDRSPHIVTVIHDDKKSKVLAESLALDNIFVTGNSSHIYSYWNILDESRYKNAYGIYELTEKHYGGEPDFHKFFMQKQVDIRSCFSNAIHTKYKVYSYLKTDEVQDITALEAAVNENIELLTELEHRRWCAFQRSEGWISAPNEPELQEFLKNNARKGKIHKDENAKVHGCITPFEKLDRLSELVYEVHGKQTDFKELNRLIAKKIPDLWRRSY